MWRYNITLTATLAAVALHLSPPEATSAEAVKADSAKVGPARVEKIDGTQLRRVTLMQKAAQRLDIRTAQVRQDPSGQKIVPHTSLLYDLAGVGWVYTNPEPLTYIRHNVVVASIKGEDAYLKDGPPAGTQVVTMGVSELYGTEKGVGH